MNKRTLSCLVLLLISYDAQAQSPSFDYIDFGYVEQEVLLIDADGFELKGSKELSENFYLSGTYTDISGKNYSSKSTSMGLGYKLDLSSFTLFFAEVDYVNLKVDASQIINNSDLNIQFRDVDSGHLESTLGVRHNLTEKTEVLFAVKIADHLNTPINFILAGNYSLTDDFKVYGNVDFHSGNSQYSFGVRYNF